MSAKRIEGAGRPGDGANQDTRRKETAMTKHMTGTREEWLAARLELLEAEKELNEAQRRGWRGGGRSCRGSDRQGVSIPRRRGERLAGGPLPRALAAPSSTKKNFMFGPDYTAGCPSCSAIADGSTASVVHLANTTSRLRRCRGRLSRSCRRTSGGWGGRFPGRLVRQRLQLHLNVWFTEEQQSEGPLNTTTARGKVEGTLGLAQAGGEGPVAEIRP